MMTSVKYLDVFVFIDDFNYFLCKYIDISLGFFLNIKVTTFLTDFFNICFKPYTVKPNL